MQTIGRSPPLVAAALAYRRICQRHSELVVGAERRRRRRVDR